MQTLMQLATLTQSKFRGDKNIEVETVASLENAKQGQISFVSNTKYTYQLKETNASIVILSPKLAENYSGNALINDDPYLTFAKVVDILHQELKPTPSVHDTAIISSDSELDSSISVGPNVVIEKNVIIAENVIIGAGSFIGKGSIIDANVKIHPNVSIYKDSKVGTRSIIHSGAVIGADGFGFAPQADKSWYKIKQIGNVVIGQDVEIGASTTIDRAALGSTIIDDGVKLDNQVHIGHNVKVGANTAIAANTVIGGSSVIGKRCQMGGAVAISGHLIITDDVIITGKSMVIKSIKKAGMYSSGVATEENKVWRKNAARFRHLDDMAKKISLIEKKLNNE